jgi:hypothetical protein
LHELTHHVRSSGLTRVQMADMFEDFNEFYR